MLSRNAVAYEVFQRLDAAFNPWPVGRLLTQEEINALNWWICEGVPMTREEWCEEGKKVVRELRGFQQELDHVQRVQHPWLVGKPLTEEEISAFATQQNVAYPWEKESCPSPEAKRKSGGRLKGISQILATPMTWLKRKLIER